MKYPILLCCFCASITAHAYPYGETSLSDPPNSSAYNLKLADSLLETKDSMEAAVYFLKVDPYTLLGTIDDMAPDKLDGIFDHYIVPKAGRDVYTKKFIACYDAAAANAVYQTFKRMRADDQLIRRIEEDAPDSIASAKAWNKMDEIDSVNRTYVLQYLHKHKKWPTPEDGSYLAYILVWHDRFHPERYLPLLYQAVINGEAEAVWYNNFVELKRDMAMGMMKRLTYPNKVAIDVSSLINDVYPSKVTKKIDSIFKKHCPIKDIYFVYYSRSKSDFNVYSVKSNFWAWTQYDESNLFSVLYNHIAAMCKPTTFILDYLPSDFKKQKLIMYIFY